MTCWCLIPARGGSKGLPGKNLRTVGGLSLVARAVVAARAFAIDARLTDARVIVDTDDGAIAGEARLYGAEVPFLRDPSLAGDACGSVDTVLGFLDREGTAQDDDVVILLQPTSPLRTAADILACWQPVAEGRAVSTATVQRTTEPVELALEQAADGRLCWRAGEEAEGRRRQDTTATVHLTGAVYVTRVEALRRTRRFVVSGVTRGIGVAPLRSVDVDTADDLALADALARAAQPSPVTIGGRALGPGQRTMIIAEAGVNHDGDPTIAHALIDAAADAGADAVKFQTFLPELLVAAEAPTAAYQFDRTGATDQRTMLEQLTLPSGAWPALAAHASRRGIAFLSTPFDVPSADLLDRLDVQAFKVPSGELTNLPLLRNLASRGRPLLVSTGMATMAEVAEALLTIRAAGHPPVVLLHCVSAYPAPADACNLAAMQTLAAAFSVPVGWSDHTDDATACVAATALGAVVLEKHLTLDRSRTGPDHAASLEPGAFGRLVRDVRTVEQARGDGRKRPMPCEANVRQVARRSFHAARDLPAGTVLAEDDLVLLRPAVGIAPIEAASIYGRPLRRALQIGEVLRANDLAAAGTAGTVLAGAASD